MPNQHSRDKQAVTYRLHRDLLARVKETAAALNEPEVALVERALALEVENRVGGARGDFSPEPGKESRDAAAR